MSLKTFWLAIIIVIESSSGDPCVEHRNPVIHGSTGMSEVALAEIGYLPKDVHCNIRAAKEAAWKYQERYAFLTNNHPFNMARLHAVGPGAYKAGRTNREYMRRFSVLFRNYYPVFIGQIRTTGA